MRVDDELGSVARRRAVVTVKLLVAAGALGWTVTRAPLADLRAATLRLSVARIACVLAFALVPIVVTAMRSGAILAAFAAPRPLRTVALARLQLQGLFFNTYLPGNAAGDLVRAHAIGRAFGGHAGGGYVVVFVERLFGLAGLLMLVSTTLLVHPIDGVARSTWLAAIGWGGAAIGVIVPLLGRRLSKLPGRVGRLFADLPVVEKPFWLGAALLLSIANQAVVALIGWLLIVAIQPTVPLLDGFVLVPVASAAAYFPATIAGIGVRDAALVALLLRVGVARGDATAASLAMTAVQLLVAAIGGLAVVFLRTIDDRDFNDASRPADA